MRSTILVVEDERGLADLLDDILTEEGYMVERAAHGRDALARLAQVHVDLVLSDVIMPLMDGEALCRAIQADPQHQHIPVVLMSASSQFPQLANCTPMAVVAKPFDLDQVLNTVARHLRLAARTV